MTSRSHSYIVLMALGLASLLASGDVLAAKANCDDIWFKEKTHTHEVDPKDLHQCLIRGWDPPKEWREDEGKSPGIRVSGSGGFSYGSVTAPESTARLRNANASVNKEVIKSVCQFPPRVKIGVPPTVVFPKGSCYDFFNDLMKDVNGDTYSSPAPNTGVNPNDSCPAESDTTGIYGLKQSVAAGGSFAATCGGMVPTNNAQLTLNSGADMVAITRNGSRQIVIYRKSGASYTLVASSPLASFLCGQEMRDSVQFNEKTIDLTAPIGQVITFDNTVGSIAVRLQSRAHMDPNFIPPYDENDPEKYLIIPIDGSGKPDIPTDCASQATYFMEPIGIRRDITIEPSYILEAECNTVNVDQTQYNDGEPKCPPASTKAADGKCYDDATGVQVPPLTVDEWKGKCPCSPAKGCLVCMDGKPPKDGQCPAPVGGCPHTGGLPPTTQLCMNNKPPVNGQCPNTCTAGGNTNSADCNSLGGFVMDPPACGSAAMLCDVATIIPTNAPAACMGKSQYAVLNRPNLYYPPGTTAKIYPIAGQAFAIAETAVDTQFFASGQTVLHLQTTAPALKLNEGGFVKLKDESIVIMSPSAIVDASKGKITLTGGGERVSSGGTQLQTFAEGAVYNIPGAMKPDVLQIKLGRNLTFPSGFTIPTVGNPYMRLPIDKPPE